MRWRHIALAILACAGAAAWLNLYSSGTTAHGTPAVEVQAGGASQTTAEAPAGDAARGQQVFERRCTGCHAMDANREGPRLRDVYGRKAASLAGFQYSESLRRSGLTWNAETLDQWLTDPDAFVPGNNMSIVTPKPTDRRDLIAYLQEAAKSE